MTIKDELVKARHRQDFKQLELAFESNYSRETISKVETGDRKYQPEMRRPFAESVDDPEFFFHTWEDAAGHVHIPYFDGDHIYQDPLALHHLVDQEAQEAMEKLDQVKWHKPHSSRSDVEKEEIKRLIYELLDAAASMVNLVAILCRDYGFSMKGLFKDWIITLKARRYKK
ncbi:helix-turn-helix domain-containing protein [Halobacillus naozhouensis]|uniref:Helix-turn-helix transcriptional regulator n=1 Tax=Halobacillus naozhouensis TaxID=554880 RepID=A0ABY8J1H9_9BACI|nr:helix-turn-helix transcriptional regulator [Halobacillus naozhouensis]WFT76210.1 helix-turn-helix transcriptional regulator [Halobacillus naozhouensis]